MDFLQNNRQKKTKFFLRHQIFIIMFFCVLFCLESNHSKGDAMGKNQSFFLKSYGYTVRGGSRKGEGRGEGIYWVQSWSQQGAKEKK